MILRLVASFMDSPKVVTRSHIWHLLTSFILLSNSQIPISFQRGNGLLRWIINTICKNSVFLVFGYMPNSQICVKITLHKCDYYYCRNLDELLSSFDKELPRVDSKGREHKTSAKGLCTLSFFFLPIPGMASGPESGRFVRVWYSCRLYTVFSTLFVLTLLWVKGQWNQPIPVLSWVCAVPPQSLLSRLSCADLVLENS